MSTISSFALECARSGRWLRGLMALQGHTLSTKAAARHACVAVAQVAAAHSWEAALSLLHPMDVLQHTQEMCNTIDVVSRHPQLPIEVYEDVVAALLKFLVEREEGSRNGQKEGSQVTQSSTSALTPSMSLSSFSTKQLQRRLFLSATQWCNWETATRLLSSLPSPPPRACVERVHALHLLRHRVLHDVGPFSQWAATEEEECGAYKPNKPTTTLSLFREPVESMAEKLQQLEGVPHGSQHRRYSARDRRELARLRELKRKVLLQRAQAEEAVLVQQAFTAVAPSVVSICAALRALVRPPSAPTFSTHQHDASRNIETVFSVVQSSRLTPELALLYARAVGLLCPQRWAEALAVLHRVEVRGDDKRSRRYSLLQEQMNFWLVSRGSWGAALDELSSWPGNSTTAPTPTQFALDTVRRTALPPHFFHRVDPQRTRPWYRLSAHQDEPVTRQIAAALARGVRLDEVQLSVAGKQWAVQGRWENALQLYYRFPLREFQKYAARSFLKTNPALPTKKLAEKTGAKDAAKNLETRGRDGQTLNVMAVLRLLVPEGGIRYTAESPARPAPPLDVFPATLLIDAAPDWVAALEVFRGCIRSGTQCSPHLLSTLLHHTDFPPKILRQVLASYPAAINDGVRRHAKEAYGMELP